MTETNVFELTQLGTFSDPLTEVLRNGARTLLGQAIEAEVAAWLSTHTDKLTDDGRRRLVSRYRWSLMVFKSGSAPFVLRNRLRYAIWRRQAD